MKFKEFDVYVIVNGFAGQTVAKTCAEEGLKVVIADNRDLVERLLTGGQRI